MRASLPAEALVTVDDAWGYARLVLIVAFLAGAAALVNRLGGLQLARADLTAALRATVQLAAVGVVIAVVPWRRPVR